MKYHPIRLQLMLQAVSKVEDVYTVDLAKVMRDLAILQAPTASLDIVQPTIVEMNSFTIVMPSIPPYLLSSSTNTSTP